MCGVSGQVHEQHTGAARPPVHSACSVLLAFTECHAILTSALLPNDPGVLDACSALAELLACHHQPSPCLQTLQRRCYWMLEGDGDIVLVHYLVAGQGSRIRATTAAQNAAAAQVCAEALSELV